MILRVILNITCENSSKKVRTVLPFSPIEVKPKPKNIANTMTGITLPSAICPIKLPGIISKNVPLILGISRGW